MSMYSRKEFLGLSAVLAGGVGCAEFPDIGTQDANSDKGQQPDLAVINGRVYTKPCRGTTKRKRITSGPETRSVNSFSH